jgi:hypothetical protein
MRPACRIVFDRAPLLRFRPLQHSLAASRAFPEGSRPSGRSRFGVFTRPPAHFTRTVNRAVALAVFRYLGECDVGVLAVADDFRGRTFRPDPPLAQAGG